MIFANINIRPTKDFTSNVKLFYRFKIKRNNQHLEKTIFITFYDYILLNVGVPWFY